MALRTGRPISTKTRRRTRCARAAAATLMRSLRPPTRRANRIGRFHALASANIRSAPEAQAGNSQNSGAQTIRAPTCLIKYPPLGWLVWTTAWNRMLRPSTFKSRTRPSVPRSQASRPICGMSSARASVTSQAARRPRGSLPQPPSSITRSDFQRISRPAGANLGEFAAPTPKVVNIRVAPICTLSPGERRSGAVSDPSKQAASRGVFLRAHR